MSSDIPETVQRTLDSAISTYEALSAAHTEASADPLCGAAAWVAYHSADLDGLLRLLGASILRWALQGGGITFVDPDEAVDPPAPAPVPAPAPAPALAPAPAPAPPPPSGESLELLRQRLQESSLSADPAGHSSSAQRIRDLMAHLERLGSPVPPASHSDFAAQISLISSVLALLPDFTLLPSDLARTSVGMLAARLRFMQSEVREDLLPVGASGSFVGLFSRLSAFMSANPIGFVHGLARSHAPQHGSWLQDAQLLWARVSVAIGGERPPHVLLDELEALLEDYPGDEPVLAAVEAAIAGGVRSSDPRLLSLFAPYADLIYGTSRLRTLQQALRAHDSEPDPIPQALPSTSVPAAILALTEGRRVLCVGGGERFMPVRLFEQVFRFSAVEWNDGRSPRRIASAAERIHGGGVDIVLLITRFISHKAIEQLGLRQAPPGVFVCRVERGTGLSAVVMSMARAAAIPDAEIAGWP